MNSPRVSRVTKSHYQDMYKSPSSCKKSLDTALISDSNNNESPSWRNVYKKRCFDEFKKSRQKLVNRFRCLDVSKNGEKFLIFENILLMYQLKVNVKDNKTAKDYLEQELQKICLLEATTQPELKINPDEAAEIYKQIQMELIPTSYGEFSEEQLLEILQQEEINEMRNQEAVNSNLSTVVVCPVCQKSNLVQEQNLICCLNPAGCSFRFDVMKMNLQLCELERRLKSAISKHECAYVPSFEFKTGIQPNTKEAEVLAQLSGSKQSCFLLMSCDKCQDMQFIF